MEDRSGEQGGDGGMLKLGNCGSVRACKGYLTGGVDKGGDDGFDSRGFSTKLD